MDCVFICGVSCFQVFHQMFEEDVVTGTWGSQTWSGPSADSVSVCVTLYTSSGGSFLSELDTIDVVPMVFGTQIDT